MAYTHHHQLTGKAHDAHGLQELQPRTPDDAGEVHMQYHQHWGGGSDSHLLLLFGDLPWLMKLYHGLGCQEGIPQPPADKLLHGHGVCFGHLKAERKALESPW